MRKIVTAITAASLALSMMAQAVPAAAAVSGYDSAYAGESAFVNLAPGQSNDFQVFFANTGTTTWTKGTSTQVDLAACLDDKVTCNAQDATEAPWNPGTWLSATRYATSTQTSVAPGSIGTFKYTVTAPASAAAGTYHFNGDLVLDSTGAAIHPEGYFQDATLGAAGSAATLTSVTPNTGSSNGGTAVTLAGTNFSCTPAFPTVNFGANAAAVTSCGAGTITATSPAGAVGTVSVTVTNAGAAASNGVDYTYLDTTKPVITAISANGNTITVTWSEPVCRLAGAGNVFAATDYVISVNGGTVAATADTAATADATPPTVCTSTFDVTSGTPFVNGDQVSLTLTATGAAKFEDVAGNAPVAQTKGPVTATGDTTKPQMASAASKSDGLTLKVTYTEPVTCNGLGFAQFSVTPTGGAATTATGLSCTALPSGSTTVNVTFPGGTFASGVGGTVTYTQSATTADRIKDRVGNDAVSPQTLTYTSFSGASNPTADPKMLASEGTGTGPQVLAPAVPDAEAAGACTGGRSDRHSAVTTDTAQRLRESS